MTVKQIENLLMLLAYFAERKKPATLADVVEQFGWPRSSTFNILTTLVENGYLYEPRARGGFYPSPRWLQIAQQIAEGEPLPDRLLQVMKLVAEETKETVWISAASGLHAVLIDVMESQASIRYTASPGSRVPIHATASGQALLCQLSDKDIGVILRKVSYTQYGGTSAPMSQQEVWDRIEAGRRQGWFQSAAAYSPDLGGVAVPIMDGTRAYAVTVAGPLFRVHDKIALHGQILHQAIAKVYGSTHSRDTLKNFNTEI